MELKIVLFDLDGTLLPMDQEQFTRYYFKLLAQKAAPHGYDPQKLINAIWTGTAAMVGNNGSQTNEAAFWKSFSEIYGEKALADKSLFDEFYIKEFQEAKAACGYNPLASSLISYLKELGYRVALATNPIFPATATESRIRWAGLSPDDFEFYTTYENSCYCKPNLNYYKAVLGKLGAAAEECLMVGNDVSEDMVANELGLSVFLLTDCLINKGQKDLSLYPHGGFAQLRDFLESKRKI